MGSHRTTSSGNELTMITGLGGAPVDRHTADQLCRERVVPVSAPSRRRAEGSTPARRAAR